MHPNTDLALRTPYRALPPDASAFQHRYNLVALLAQSKRRLKLVKPYNLLRRYIADQSRMHPQRIAWHDALAYYFGHFAASWLESHLRVGLTGEEFIDRMLSFKDLDTGHQYEMRVSTPDEMRAERLDNIAFKREFEREVVFNRDMQYDRRQALAAALGNRMGHVNPRLFTHRWCVREGHLSNHKKLRAEAARLFGNEAAKLLTHDLSTNRQTLSTQLRDIER